MKNTIVVFTLNGCVHCIELKKKLNAKNIPFHEVEVSANQDIWNNVVQQTGDNALPAVYVSLDNGDHGPIFIPEKDYSSQEELLEKLSEFI